MRKCISALLATVVSFSALAQETSEQRRSRKGQEAPSLATREATVFSLMGWGLGIAVGIAALCALIENNPASTTANNSSNNGSTSH